MVGATMVEGTLFEGAVVADRYVLSTSLGDGGFGEVWRAQDRRFGRAVAVKFMRAELARDAALRRRFAKEARALAAINHPNVVQVFDDGEWQGRPFVVLQLVAGSTLREWMEGYQKIRKLPPAEEVRALFAQVCDGVGAAHAKGIVHRDLKPENVLIEFDEEGRSTAKVLDFGLARGGTSQTSTGLPGGTIQYMSPEQATEGVEAAGPESDVFALGVMLVELLTRRLLPEAPKQTTWWNAAQLGRAGSALGEAARVRGDVPTTVWSVLWQALSAVPSARPANAGALRRSVETAWSVAGVTSGAAVGGSVGAAATGVRVAPMPSVAVIPSMVLGHPAPVMAARAQAPSMVRGTSEATVTVTGSSPLSALPSVRPQADATGANQSPQSAPGMSDLRTTLIARPQSNDDLVFAWPHPQIPVSASCVVRSDEWGTFVVGGSPIGTLDSCRCTLTPNIIPFLSRGIDPDTSEKSLSVGLFFVRRTQYTSHFDVSLGSLLDPRAHVRVAPICRGDLLFRIENPETLISRYISVRRSDPGIELIAWINTMFMNVLKNTIVTTARRRHRFLIDASLLDADLVAACIANAGDVLQAGARVLGVTNLELRFSDAEVQLFEESRRKVAEQLAALEADEIAIQREALQQMKRQMAAGELPVVAPPTPTPAENAPVRRATAGGWQSRPSEPWSRPVQSSAPQSVRWPTINQRVLVSMHGGPFQAATVLEVNQHAGMVRVRLDSGFDGWVAAAHLRATF